MNLSYNPLGTLARGGIIVAVFALHLHLAVPGANFMWGVQGQSKGSQLGPFAREGLVGCCCMWAARSTRLTWMEF